MTPPLTFQWDGEAMVPASQYWAHKADEEYVIGQTYRLVEPVERSGESHRHYFAALHDAWANLPDHIAEQFPSSEHLRKFALIKCGFYDQTSYSAQSDGEAARVHALLAHDEFAIVTIDGQTVTRFTPKSQSMKAMGKRKFQESKQAVLDYVADLIGVKPEELAANAGRAA
jgi:hypothetical protein